MILMTLKGELLKKRYQYLLKNSIINKLILDGLRDILKQGARLDFTSQLGTNRHSGVRIRMMRRMREMMRRVIMMRGD